MEAPVVIVGGGTAGCTVASHLAARTSRRIIVCEPGQASSRDDHPGFFDGIADDALLKRIDVEVSSHRPVVPYLQACAIGGGSAVNAMVLSGDEPRHLRGLTRYSRTDDMGDVSRALLASGGERVRLWWNRGRWNPGRALLHLVEEGRVEIRRDLVMHLEFDGTRVVGVRCRGESIETDLVVLTAGAIESPRLLLRSGCSDAVPRIGEGLQDHPCITFVLPLTKPNSARFDATSVKRIETEDGSKGLCVAYERANAHDTEHALLSVMLLNPRSTGSLSVSGDVHLNLLALDSDQHAMATLVRRACTLLSSPAFVRLGDEPFGDDQGTTVRQILEMSDNRLYKWLHGALTPVSHVSGSLRHCVDRRGRVRGLDGVVVADASVLPGVPHETPAAPVTMEAMRIARALGEELA